MVYLEKSSLKILLIRFINSNKISGRMKGTLYNQMQKIEEMDKGLKELQSSNNIDIHELQGKLFKKYQENPVLMEAIKGRQTLEESLEEIGHINKGIRKILPWRKDKIHNERVDQIGKLISKPYHLYTSGIFTPDNMITVGAWITGTSFVATYILTRLLIPAKPYNPDMNMEEFQMIKNTIQWLMPVIGSVCLTPILGSMANQQRFTKLPTEEAKYLDTKVKEFYR